MNQPQLNTYAPGTQLTVGTHKARIVKYLTSGGFAQVYTAEISPPDPHCNSNLACLKRVIVPDKASLNTLRAEVDAMRLLRNNKYIVSYIDSHAAKSGFHNGSYEVFLIMEYCAGGGLIDFMNARLQNRLQEFEVLDILSQVSQGIAAMHSLKPPLIHRDIKIENVLLSGKGEYKVCDFGSVCGVIRPPRNQQELAYVQHDVMKNTTAQYRSPEMLDMYRGLPIDEKADIWALGVFLYKLCYYTTPFEKGGEAAILHSRFEFPAYPHYSDRLKNLIRVMLLENATKRPNICQVLEEVSRIQGVPCPIRNFYLARALQQAHNVPMQNIQPPLQMHPGAGSVPQQAIPAQDSFLYLHHSTTVPALPNFQGSPVKPTASIPIVASKSNTNLYSTFVENKHNGNSSRSSLVGVPMYNKDQSTQKSFPELKYNVVPSLPKSHTVTAFNSGNLSTSPSRYGRGDIGKIVEANPTQFDRPNNYVDSDTQTYDIDAPFSKRLSRAGSIHSLSTVSSQGSIRENTTGGSLVRTLSAKLKKVITGEKPQNTSPIRSFNHTGGSIRSLHQGITGGSSRNTSSDLSLKRAESIGKYKFRTNEASYSRLAPSRTVSDVYLDSQKSGSPVTMTSNQSSKDTIKKRVQNLLKTSENSPTPKTATGYGKYNEKINSLESKSNTDSNRYPSVKITPVGKNQSGKEKPRRSRKPEHLRPERPPKPAFLLGKKTKEAST